jgi:hypothetical protein
VIEIDERTTFPKVLLKLIPGDDLTGLPDEGRQNLQRLSFHPHTHPVFVQLARSFIERERTEDELPGRTGGGLAAHLVRVAQGYQI